MLQGSAWTFFSRDWTRQFCSWRLHACREIIWPAKVFWESYLPWKCFTGREISARLRILRRVFLFIKFAQNSRQNAKLGTLPRTNKNLKLFRMKYPRILRYIHPFPFCQEFKDIVYSTVSIIIQASSTAQQKEKDLLDQGEQYHYTIFFPRCLNLIWGQSVRFTGHLDYVQK